MISGFEQYTHDLTPNELNTALPAIVEELKTRNSRNKAITSMELIAATAEKCTPHLLTPPRVRKIINHIRNNGIVEGLIASSKGYYVTSNPVELARYIDSLKGRAGAITTVSNSMKAYMIKLIHKQAA